MRSRRFVALTLAAGLVVTLALWPAGAPGPARADVVFVSQQVRDEIAANGRARVIVEVQLPGAFIAEGALPTWGQVLTQRTDIAFAQSRVFSRLQGYGHSVLHRFDTVPYVVLEIESDALRELEGAGSDVRRVVEDARWEPLLPQSVPLVEGNQAWAQGFDGTGMTVAIVDTGVDKTHPFLAGKVVEEACYSTNSPQQTSSLCPNGQAEQTGPGTGVNCAIGGPSDLCFHGTHVAGIATGNGASAGVPFSGVAKGAQIMAVQVFSRGIAGQLCGGQPPPCLTTFQSDIIKGLERVYAVRDQHVFGAVNLSVGGGFHTSNCDDDPTKPVIDNLRSVGIPTVIASGNNSGVSSMSAPACVSTAVSVGNTGKDDVVWPSSNVAPFLSLFAPGGSILSSVPGGQWMTLSGTSMAAPHVSGAFAILKQASPGASVDTLLTALQQTGVPITDTRPAGFVTKPRIRIAHALAALAPPPPRTLSVTSTNPPSGVAITVSPVDNGGQGNGTTPFSRVYGAATVVNLTAATTAQSKTFQKWQQDGVDVSTNASVQVALDVDHMLNAVYVVSDFVDVPPSHPFWSWIEALFRAGITSGCGTNPPVFCPDQTVSRAEMAVFLLRSIHGAGYAPPAPTSVFADVPVSDPFAAWIDRLFAEGIVGGCGTNPLRYCPSDDVTRAQMAILLLRAKHGAGYQPPAASGLFADVAPNDPFAPWIEQLFAEGVTTGCGTNPLRYCPGQSVTRGQTAAFLDRTFGFPP
jgi:subtilisin family serine protease